MEQSEVEEMFWKMPEVVKRLYSSALSLLQSYAMDKDRGEEPLL